MLLGLARFSLLLGVIQGLVVNLLRFEGWLAQWLVGVARLPSRRARYALTLVLSSYKSIASIVKLEELYLTTTLFSKSKVVSTASKKNNSFRR